MRSAPLTIGIIYISKLFLVTSLFAVSFIFQSSATTSPLNESQHKPSAKTATIQEKEEGQDDTKTKIKKFRVGVSFLNSYPLFSFANVEDKGLGWMILEEFGKQHNIEFEYVAMPMTRLQAAMDTEAIDFIFPDNPLWVAFRSNRTPNIYSGPLFSATSSSFVRVENKDLPVSDIKKVAIPFGYTAITWVDPIKEHGIKSVPVRDLASALERVRSGSADAADVEYNIGQHLINTDPRLSGLTINKNLPNVSVDFHVSSIKHILILEKLTAFIQKEEALIEELKARYNIKTHEQVFGE